MDSILQNAIESAQKAEVAFSKFISANDAGLTKSHQAGFYVPKSFCPFVFEKEIIKNSDYEKFVDVKWQNDFVSQSRFKYYGSKNECHLTRDVPFRNDDNVGNLLVICKIGTDYYEAFVLENDDDIEGFMAALNITIGETNGIIEKGVKISSEDIMGQCFKTFISSLKAPDFPSTIELSNNSRFCFNQAYNVDIQHIKDKPDEYLLKWLDAEFQLFKLIENNTYADLIKTPFTSVEELIEIANKILNRRKSRAGKSLENHLAEIFTRFSLQFQSQIKTEDDKKPDFIFPSQDAYNNIKYDESKLFLLASKTTCKDRWRQVLNEGDRIKTKHLFTLQQGVSSKQLNEMTKSGVQLVVPSDYVSHFPPNYQEKLLTLDTFVKIIQKSQS